MTRKRPPAAVYTLKTGMIRYFLVDEDKDFIYLLVDNITHVDVVLETRKAFHERYRHTGQLYDPTMLAGILSSMMDGGITALAGRYLRDLVPVDQSRYQEARRRGDATVVRHKEEGAKMEQADVKAGKAPRKLAGAALLAKQRKEEREREAAEAELAKSVASEVSEELKEQEKAGAPDVRLPTQRTNTGKRTKIDKEIEQVVEAKVKAKDKKTKPKSTDGFDPAILKDKNGRYTSVSAMCKGLVLANVAKPKDKRKTDEQLFLEVQKVFDIGDDKKNYIAWNRRWLINNGIIEKDA